MANLKLIPEEQKMMNIKVLGPGCAKCKALERVTRKAVEEMKSNAVVEKVEDIQEIMGYGVMRTPALVINDQVVMSGQLPKIAEVKELIGKYSGAQQYHGWKVARE